MTETVNPRDGAKMPSGRSSPKLDKSQDLLVRSHSDRGRIVQCIKDSPDGEMAVSQIARELGEDPKNLNYHVLKLAEAGVLEKTRTGQITKNRPPAKFYRLNPAFLARTPDDVTLDHLASYLREHNGSVDAARVREFVRATGRLVSPGEAPPVPVSAPAPVEPAKAALAGQLKRMQRLPLQRRCQCPDALTDDENLCVSCSKPQVANEVMA